MRKHIASVVWAFLIVPIIASSNLLAQGSIDDGILALIRNVTAQQLEIGGRLYGGTIEGTIANYDQDQRNFGDVDLMTRFSIVSTERGGTPLVFSGGNKAEFNSWVDANATSLLSILFPGSLSAGVAGVDAARNFSQTFFLTTMLGNTTVGENRSQRKTNSGGFIEREWFKRTDQAGTSSGSAWQGLFQIDKIHVSLQGRYARPPDDIDIRSYSFGADFHPFVELKPNIHLRVGMNARSGILYSTSKAMDLGSIDYGLGGWTSVQKDFSRVRLGAGTIFQGSNSYIPTSLFGEGLQSLAAALNDRGIQYNLTYGAITGYQTSDRTSLNLKLLETRAIVNTGARGLSRVALVSFSYLLAGHTPLDFGYKYSTGDGFKAASVFVQGNFRW